MSMKSVFSYETSNLMDLKIDGTKIYLYTLWILIYVCVCVYLYTFVSWLWEVGSFGPSVDINLFKPSNEQRRSFLCVVPLVPTKSFSHNLSWNILNPKLTH